MAIAMVHGDTTTPRLQRLDEDDGDETPMANAMASRQRRLADHNNNDGWRDTATATTAHQRTHASTTQTKTT